MDHVGHFNPGLTSLVHNKRRPRKLLEESLRRFRQFLLHRHIRKRFASDSKIFQRYEAQRRANGVVIFRIICSHTCQRSVQFRSSGNLHIGSRYFLIHFQNKNIKSINHVTRYFQETRVKWGKFTRMRSGLRNTPQRPYTSTTTDWPVRIWHSCTTLLLYRTFICSTWIWEDFNRQLSCLLFDTFNC